MADPSIQLDEAEMRRVQADGAVLFCGTNLRIRIAVLKAGLVLVSAQGEVADPEDSRVEAAVMAELDRELERAGKLTVFADIRESPRMPAASREKIAKWMRRHQARLLPSHILVRSKLIEMAVSIITMLVGSGVFEMHTKPEVFLKLLKKAAPQLTALPVVPEQ